MAKLHEWEMVCREGNGQTDRMEVPGGWIYRHGPVAIGSTPTMVFVPERAPPSQTWHYIEEPGAGDAIV